MKEPKIEDGLTKAPKREEDLRINIETLKVTEESQEIFQGPAAFQEQEEMIQDLWKFQATEEIQILMTSMKKVKPFV